MTLFTPTRLAAVTFIFAFALVGCDQSGPSDTFATASPTSSTSSKAPQECNWEEEDCSTGGTTTGGTTTGGTTTGGTTTTPRGTCPSDWRRNYKIPTTETGYETIALTSDLIGDSDDSQVDGKAFTGRLVASYNEYETGVYSRRVNAMTQIQINCGGTWRTPHDDDFANVRVKAELQFINDIPLDRLGWSQYGESAFRSVRESLTNDHYDGSDLHVKEGGTRLYRTGLMWSRHSVSKNNGATWTQKKEFRGDSYMEACPSQNQYRLVALTGRTDIYCS